MSITRLYLRNTRVSEPEPVRDGDEIRIGPTRIFGLSERESSAMTITGRHALVTGGSRGIGRGIALNLAEQGVHIAINYLKDEASARRTLEQIRARGADGFIAQADVSDPAQIERLFDQVKSEFGSLDILVANARPEVAAFYQPAMSIGLEQWDAAMNSQARAFLLSVREAEKLMPDNGRVIAITYAPGGRYGSWQSWVGMGAAKSALETLARYFAVALAPRGITVNIISPGWIEDSVLNSLPEPVVEMIRDHHKSGWTPMRRLGTPADIGNAVSLLCSKEAAWITGQLLAVDGGMSLMDPGLPLAIQQPELQPQAPREKAVERPADVPKSQRTGAAVRA
jgi:NAD(P)-dependent dehydrogenase (short-subunit alcohol dehydrogenase family)